MKFSIIRNDPGFKEFWAWLKVEASSEYIVIEGDEYTLDIWLNGKIGEYREKAELIPNKWYMVKVKDRWFPAKHDPKTAGGWTNEDTWEDSEAMVLDWRPIKFDV